MKFPREFPDIPDTCGGDLSGGPNGGDDDDDDDDDDGCTDRNTGASQDYAEAEEKADAAWYDCKNSTSSFEIAANRTANGTCSSITTGKKPCDDLWYCVEAYYRALNVGEDAIKQWGPPSLIDESDTVSDSTAALPTSDPTASTYEEDLIATVGDPPTSDVSKIPVVPVTVAVDVESLNRAETAGAGEDDATTDEEETATTDEEAATTDEEAATTDGE